MSSSSRFLRIGLAAMVAFSWNAALFSDSAIAAPRKAKHQVKPKHKAIKKKKKQVTQQLVAQESASLVSEAPIAAPPQLSSPPCPSAGNIGITDASEWNSIISNNLGRTIEICNDLVFTSRPTEIPALGFSGLAPFESMNGFQGVLEGNGHTISMLAPALPPGAQGLTLGFELIQNGTIQNLTIDARNTYGPDAHPDYLIAEYATNATIRNLTLKNIQTASGVVYSGRRVHFDSVQGDLILRPGATQRVAGALTQLCEDCVFSNSNLSIIMDSPEGSTGSSYPTYSGGLVGVAYGGSLTVRNSILTGEIRRGYDRGMIAGALNGEPSQLPAPDGSYPTPQLLIDGVRVTNVDLRDLPDVVSYTVGALVGRASLPTIITRTLVRDSNISSDRQAGGLIGGATLVTASEVAVSRVSVSSKGVAGGMIGWNSGQMQIEDSYFDGEVMQSEPIPFGGSAIIGAGGVLGFANDRDTISRVYVSARVTAENADDAGAIIGANPGALGFGSVTSEHVYFNRSLADQAGSLGVGLSAEEMTLPASFVGFRDSEWTMQAGKLPRLRNRPLYLVQDLFNFLSLYFAQSIRADTNKDGVLSVEDLFRFLDQYHAQ
ncbi:MAG: hypothetical protein J0M12_15030 [Deltaproteobacteria bacterium]|nr:hypothetical protein [Deltaproteobacteria bacterium]